MERAVWTCVAILFGLVFLVTLVTELSAIIEGDGIALVCLVVFGLGVIACLRARKHSTPVR